MAVQRQHLFETSGKRLYADAYNLKQLKSEKRWKRGKHVFWIRTIKNQWIFEETFDVILHGPASTTCTFTYELRSNDPRVRMFDYQKAYPTWSMCVDGGYTPTDISGQGQPQWKVWRGFPWRGVVQTDLAFLDSATLWDQWCPGLMRMLVTGRWEFIEVNGQGSHKLFLVWASKLEIVGVKSEHSNFVFFWIQKPDQIHHNRTGPQVMFVALYPPIKYIYI